MPFPPNKQPQNTPRLHLKQECYKLCAFAEGCPRVRRKVRVKEFLTIALAIWACIASCSQVQVWCRAPEGHSAMEPLLDACCSGPCSPCISGDEPSSAEEFGTGRCCCGGEICRGEKGCTDIAVRVFADGHGRRGNCSRPDLGSGEVVPPALNICSSASQTPPPSSFKEYHPPNSPGPVLRI